MWLKHKLYNLSMVAVNKDRHITLTFIKSLFQIVTIIFNILGTQNIKHALGTQKLYSSGNYIKDFKDNIVGKPPSDLEKSYPEYDFARSVSKLASKVIYVYA